MNIWLTGCTSGLGEALVKEFVADGHVVVGGGRRQNNLDSLSEKYDSCHFLPLDVSVEKSAEDFCNEAMKRTGTPDILINNAAIINPPNNLWEISAEEFDKLTSININGVANMIRHTVPQMIEKGSGMIVNLSSGWGRSTSPEVAPYCASKWAIEGLTKALAQELPGKLATVALNPGIINTDMLQTAFGSGASDFPTADIWAKSAAPYILGFSPLDNGQSLTVPS